MKTKEVSEMLQDLDALDRLYGDKAKAIAQSNKYIQEATLKEYARQRGN